MMRRIAILFLASASTCFSAENWGGIGTFPTYVSGAEFNTDSFASDPGGYHESFSQEYPPNQNPLDSSAILPTWIVITWSPLSENMSFWVRSTNYSPSAPPATVINRQRLTIKKTDALADYSELQAQEDIAWTFGPEWAGSMVEVRSQDGTILGAWALPSVIGPEGFTLQTQLTASEADLASSSVFIDNISVGAWAIASQASSLDTAGLGKGGYNIYADESYKEVPWSIRLPDGSVQASGSDLNSIAPGAVTVSQSAPGTFYVYNEATSLVITANQTQYYAFTQNPATTVPSQESPVSTPPSAIPSDPPVAYPTPDQDGNVSFDPQTWDYEFNPTNAITDSKSVLLQIRGGIDNMREGMGNITRTLELMSGIVPSGNATSTCQFQFGTVTLDLSSMSFLREGLKWFVLITFVMAIIALLREALRVS